MKDKTYRKITDGFLKMCHEDKELLEQPTQLLTMEGDYED